MLRAVGDNLGRNDGGENGSAGWLVYFLEYLYITLTSTFKLGTFLRVRNISRVFPPI